MSDGGGLTLIPSSMHSCSALVRSLLALREGRRTGVLTVEADGASTFVYLKGGVPVFAEEGSAGESLGRLLVRQKILTSEQHAEIIAKMTDALVLNEQLRFGEVAVELGYMTEAQVMKALADQVRWKIVRCFQRPQVTWAFEDSESRLDDVGNFPMKVEALLLSALRWLDDEDKSELALKRIEQAPMVLTESSTETAHRFDLSAPERAFAACFDGKRTTLDILAGQEAQEVDGPAITAALAIARAITDASVQKRGGVVTFGRPTTPADGVATIGRPATPLQPIPLAAIAAAMGKPIPVVAPVPAPASSRRNTTPLDVDPRPAPLGRTATPFVPLAPPPTVSASPNARPTTPANVPPSSTPGLGPHGNPTVPASARYNTSPLDPTGGAPLRRPLQKTRASQILAALESHRVKPDKERNPASEHEAKLLAERAYQEGLTLVKAGRWPAAVEALQRAAQLLPSSDEYKLYAKWAVVRARSNEPPHKMERSEIARIALAAVKTDPNFAFGFYVAGDMAFLDDEVVQAVKLLARAVKLDPSNLDAQRLLRIAERRMNAKPDDGGGGILGKKLW